MSVLPMGRPSLLFVFAHPDDESFGCGGTIARYAAAGIHVALLTATRGDAGLTGGLPIMSRAELGRVRNRELECACRILGTSRLRLLDYPDGALAEQPADEVIGHIVRMMREVRPQVVVTFDPSGVTLHPDHMAIHRLASAAFARAGDPGSYPEQIAGGLEPWVPDRLYYSALPESLVREWDIADLHGVADELIGARIDISDYVVAKREALLCHRTQIKDVEGFEDEAPRPEEMYQLAVPDTVPHPPYQDLFEDLCCPVERA